MAFTYSKLAEVTVGSGGSATITLSNIPQNYNDLVIKLSGRSSRTGFAYDDLNISFNISTSNFSAKALQGAGVSSPQSFSPSNFIGQLDTTVNTSNTFNSVDVYIPNYSNSTFKSYSSDSVHEENGTSAYTNFVAGLWSNTSAINQITFIAGVGNFLQHSTATLYGVKAEV